MNQELHTSEEVLEAQTAAEAPESQEADATVALQAEINELKDQLLRALAEVENVRKRGQIDRENAHKFAVSNFAKDLLQVADTMEQALSLFEPAALKGNELLGKIVEGIRLTQQDLQKVFERYQIKRIYPMGEKFDPNFHQAMFEQPDAGEPGMVVSVLQPGYVLHDRLLRPAMVGVSK
jgi:molecular chaperone GrpE